jgi:hypothetical protein
MKIERVVWLKEIVDKLARKHHVLPEEVEQALSSKPRFYLVQRGERAGEDVYMALGRPMQDAISLCSLFTKRRPRKLLS